MSRQRVFVIALLMSGCASEAAVGTAVERIVGGQPTTTDAAVVLLFNGGNDGCSGTLISPRVVLAAAHCGTVDSVAFVDTYDSASRASTGGRGTFAVTKQWTDPAYESTGLLGGHDFTLLQLERPGPARPIPTSTTDVTSDLVNMPARLVGFGITTANDPSLVRVRRTVTTALTRFDSNVLWIQPAAACAGDSGGAFLMTLDGVERLVADINFSDSGCETDTGGNRLDTHAAEIDAFIHDNDDTPAGCGFDGVCAQGCRSPDPDCPCAADGMCTTACSQPDTDPDCPQGCLGDGRCVMNGCPLPDPDCPPPIISCALPQDCRDSICDFAVGYCATPCGDPSLPACPAGRTCVNGLCEVPAPNVAPTHHGGGCMVSADGEQNGVWILLILLTAVSRALSRQRTGLTRVAPYRGIVPMRRPQIRRSCSSLEYVTLGENGSMAVANRATKER